MIPGFAEACRVGLERVRAWSDVLDDINVFPVADGDTGRNLVMSLTPLRQFEAEPSRMATRLLLAARGNSGNIAARFLTGLLAAETPAGLPAAAAAGREMAWQAVQQPLAGTMLTVFDALVDFVQAQSLVLDAAGVAALIDRLQDAVLSTPALLPKLQRAGVVDAGALGMFIFLEGFFLSLAGETAGFRSIEAVFEPVTEVAAGFSEAQQEGYCVDTVIQPAGDPEETIGRLAEFGESVVVIPHQDYLKVHLHAADARLARHRIESLGRVVRWADDDLGLQTADFSRSYRQGGIHIVTDAAGSLTREDARELDITLLDSYLTVGDTSLPETLFAPDELYRAMRAGAKVSTSQASVFERHQYYQRVVERHARVLYLCVGAAYTGNYDVARSWKETTDPHNRLAVLDSAAASGRLAVIVRATANMAARSGDLESVIVFARRAIRDCREYLFLDQLKYLAAGGRLARSSAFFGDMLHLKPIITPTGEGARKVGVVRNAAEQLRFALDKLARSFAAEAAFEVLLEYSDNQDWVRETVGRNIQAVHPRAKIRIRPLSLTAGAHMGPGTWGLAYLPDGAETDETD